MAMAWDGKVEVEEGVAVVQETEMLKLEGELWATLGGEGAVRAEVRGTERRDALTKPEGQEGCGSQFPKCI